MQKESTFSGHEHMDSMCFNTHITWIDGSTSPPVIASKHPHHFFHEFSTTIELTHLYARLLKTHGNLTDNIICILHDLGYAFFKTLQTKEIKYMSLK